MATLPKANPKSRSLATGRWIDQLAERPALVEAQRWVGRERSWINDLHLQLCRIPAPTFFERQRAEWFRLQLENFGWNASIDRAGNVLARFGSSDEPRSVILSAHLDTVFAPAKPEEIYYLPDGRLVGPGTSDNGSGLSALLALSRLLSSVSELQGVASSLLIVANVGEEGEGNLSGMRYLCQHSPDLSGVRAFVILDGPSVTHITAQALASRRYEIVLSGAGGHSWNDHGTPNPVHVLSDMISSFVRAADAAAQGDKRNHCAYNFSVVEGGTNINSIPESARAKLDIRSDETGLLEELSDLLTNSVERSLEQGNRAAKGNRLSAKIKDLGSRPGGKLASDALLLRAILAVDSYLNIRSRVDCASTDANVPLSLGLPAVSIGAGGQGGGAHTTNEWYQPEGRELGLRRILLLLSALFEHDSTESKTNTQRT